MGASSVVCSKRRIKDKKITARAKIFSMQVPLPNAHFHLRVLKKVVVGGENAHSGQDLSSQP